MNRSKKIIMSVLLVSGLYFVVTSCPVQIACWTVQDFLNPNFLKEQEASYRKKSNDSLLDSLKSCNYSVVGISEKILRERDEKRSIPILISLMKSENETIRRESIHSLGMWQDENAAAALAEIVRQGRSNRDYIDALYALSLMHYDPMYSEILKNARDGYETSLTVAMLENFPEKPETLSALEKIASQASENYVRANAKDAIGKIKATGGTMVPSH